MCYLQGDKGEWVIVYGKPRSRECALPMKKSWLRHCLGVVAEGTAMGKGLWVGQVQGVEW